MNKEVQDSLHCLLSIALENDKYDSQREQFKIVNDYITNLEQRIYKAIEYIESNEFIGRIRLSSQNKESINKLLELLGSDKE